MNWIDRTIGYVAPQRQLSRMRARMALRVLNQHYDAAEASRRTLGWKRPAGDGNAGLSSLSLSRLRDSSRHLARNNGHAKNAVQVIIDDVIGWGIEPMDQVPEFQAWSTTSQIDADGRCNFAGLQEMVIRTIVESGECLVRRRFRRPTDGLALPMQLQVLEPDYIDTGKHGTINGRKVVRGIELDHLGRRAAYWLFREHPGSTSVNGNFRLGQSVPVPASEIAHIFKPDRPGQVRGAPWFASILLRFNDFDEFADATLMKQKIAACLAVLTTDMTGEGRPLGTEDEDDAEIDLLQPGLIKSLDPNQTIEVVDPPSVREYADYVQVTLNEIAAGIGVTPEDMTGDYSNMNFSSARMSRLRHWARVEGWRWRMLGPQFLDQVWSWAAQAAALSGVSMPASTMWTAAGMPWIEPDKEGLAILRNVRTGITTLSEELRRRGINVPRHWDEYQADFEDLDRRGLTVDADARQMTQAGQRHTDAGGEDPDATMAEARRLMRDMSPSEIDLLVREYTGGNGAHV